MDLNTIISDIEIKAKKLNNRLEKLENENDELRKTVFEYLEKLDEKEKLTTELKSTLEMNKLSKSIQINKKHSQRELDKYIHMIDKCISAINTSKK